jgi:hypothetical protein
MGCCFSYFIGAFAPNPELHFLSTAPNPLKGARISFVCYFRSSSFFFLDKKTKQKNQDFARFARKTDGRKAKIPKLLPAVVKQWVFLRFPSLFFGSPDKVDRSCERGKAFGMDRPHPPFGHPLRGRGILESRKVWVHLEV